MPETKRTSEIVNMVLEGLSEGTPLTVLCRGEGMPCDDTVRNWAADDEDLARDIARARLDGFDAIAARARMTARGKTEEQGGDSTHDVQRDKLIIDTDFKLLAKWDPKRYGDKVQHTGEGGGPIDTKVEATIRFIRPGEVADDEDRP